MMKNCSSLQEPALICSYHVVSSYSLGVTYKRGGRWRWWRRRGALGAMHIERAGGWPTWGRAAARTDSGVAAADCHACLRKRHAPSHAPALRGAAHSSSGRRAPTDAPSSPARLRGAPDSRYITALGPVHRHGTYDSFEPRVGWRLEATAAHRSI